MGMSRARRERTCLAGKKEPRPGTGRATSEVEGEQVGCFTAALEELLPVHITAVLALLIVPLHADVFTCTPRRGSTLLAKCFQGDAYRRGG